MKSEKPKQQAPRTISTLDFKTHGFFKTSQFGSKRDRAQMKFNPSQFKTQHKGGS